MKKTLSAVIALLVAMSFTLVSYADAKSPKKAKKEAEVAKQESKKAGYEAKSAEEKLRKRKAEKQTNKIKL